MPMESAQIFDTSANSFQFTWRYNPEDSHLIRKDFKVIVDKSYKGRTYLHSYIRYRKRKENHVMLKPIGSFRKSQQSQQQNTHQGKNVVIPKRYRI
jgi:hypothetical protein